MSSSAGFFVLGPAMNCELDRFWQPQSAASSNAPVVSGPRTGSVAQSGNAVSGVPSLFESYWKNAVAWQTPSVSRYGPVSKASGSSPVVRSSR